MEKPMENPWKSHDSSLNPLSFVDTLRSHSSPFAYFDFTTDLRTALPQPALYNNLYHNFTTGEGQKVRVNTNFCTYPTIF
jgi:hypothetical protein